MKRKANLICSLLISLPLLSSCSYNPFIGDNHTTGSPVGAAIGAGVGAGSIAALGGTKATILAGGLAGGAIGYYMTTLRYDSAGLLKAGGKVYKIGDMVGIYIPSDKLFEPNSDELIPQSKDILDSAATILLRYPNNNILISGNTSGFYRARWEQNLSERRAQKISAYLWNAGINNFKVPSLNMRKLNYVGHGDYFPISQKITNDGIRENNRIQITSYPNNCDLGLDKKHIAVHNVGGIDTDNEINKAPAGCNATDSMGRCLEPA